MPAEGFIVSTLLLIKLELDRSDCFGRLGVGGLDRPEHFPVLRMSTMRQRRFIREASVAGLSFLLVRRGGIPGK